jgi:hypothetical protein
MFMAKKPRGKTKGTSKGFGSRRSRDSRGSKGLLPSARSITSSKLLKECFWRLISEGNDELCQVRGIELRFLTTKRRYLSFVKFQFHKSFQSLPPAD